MNGSYVPDSLVRLVNGMRSILEIKGYEDEQDCGEHQAAQPWMADVNG
jgi:hypothetical protein